MSVTRLLTILADGEFHSGEALGERLGVSRTAIWKQLKKIEALGLRLHSIKGRGYRLPDGLDLLSVERIGALLKPSVASVLRAIELDLSIPSTSAKAVVESQNTDRHGSLYLAEQQTAGRGRRGRTWVSPFGRNLYFSLVWSFSGGAAALEGLSLVVGLAVRQGLVDCGVEGLALKWPNDLLLGQRKLAGILLEMSGDASGQCQVIIGVGINVAMSDEAGQAIDQPWADLQKSALAAGRNQILAAVLNALLPMLQQFSRDGFVPFKAAWQALNVHAGQEVVVITPRHQQRGLCAGVDDTGALLLETKDGIQACHGGEVSLRGVHDS